MDDLNRSYIGLLLPESVKAAIADAQVNIRRKAGAELVRWTPASELLLTLVPLGELSIGTLESVRQRLHEVTQRHSPIRICLEGLGGAPTVLQPRYLWTGLTGDVGALESLQLDLMQTARPLVPEMEERPLQRHVPIGRLKQESEQNRSALGRALRMAQTGSIGEWTAESFDLLRVSSGDLGPTYVSVQTYPFAGYNVPPEFSPY